jgi:ADP-ribose pyrophosphatase YjhB (NUDIX family)
MLKTRVRCAGLLFENDSLLLMRYADPDVGDIWQYPGGGLEPDETITQGVIREMREETGLTVSVDRMGYVLQLFTEEQSDLVLYFWLTLQFGELGAGVEFEPTQTEM